MWFDFVRPLRPFRLSELGGKLLPAFLSLRFLNTEMITSRFPSTSTTVVKIKTLARIAMTQAGRAVPSVARVRSSCPSRGSVRFFTSVNVSGITGPQPELLLNRRCKFMSRRYRRYRRVLNETLSAPFRVPQEPNESLPLKGDGNELPGYCAGITCGI